MNLIKHFKYSYVFASFFIFLPACSSSKPDFKEINSIQEIKTIFEQASQNDLFVFDIDDTILESSEPIRQLRFTNNTELQKIKDSFREFMKKKYNSTESLTLFLKNRELKNKIQPVEKALIENILALQKKKIKIIALTMRNIGGEERYQQLLSLGLDFSHSFEQNFSFDELQKTEYATKYKTAKEIDTNPAIFYKGVAFTGSFSKGVVLKIFLEKLSWKPTQIYFFDDKPENADSVSQEMEKMGIKCQTFVYRAAFANRSDNDLDLEVARFQVELMKQRDDNDYVDYFEAKEILQQQKGDHKTQALPIQITP
ncbi:TPA: hypothetical protein DEO28_00275 [Candidatus Dependentiae bacterium]|nr:MAG: hypothetical protein UR14_C0001G0088 [candidate division TM6 bacterium GW2011_GWE2_31_21]KKP54032.1 MAG: hypothetical protein UR43_C0001G0050 [candidate division TM6 bacterium GW2011_GWF2_33_332]HBS48386.1 hypothetical protein [Candidatus Dependentiae bacterium]HBZ72940.1 hypothetical protein [Candidatus Dependentiae bacterium]